MKKWQICFIVAINVLLFLAFSIGHKKPPEPTKPNEPTVKTEMKATTEVSYQRKQKGEKTDVEVATSPASVFVRVNGHEQELKPLVGENRKFEKGKVVVEQTSKVVFDIKPPKHNNIRVYIEGNTDLQKAETLIGIEKQNGRFIYGGTIDPFSSKKKFYTRYNILEL